MILSACWIVCWVRGLGRWALMSMLSSAMAAMVVRLTDVAGRVPADMATRPPAEKWLKKASAIWLRPLLPTQTNRTRLISLDDSVAGGAFAGQVPLVYYAAEVWGLARKIAIVTDTTADLTPEMVEELGVTVVPLQVIFGNEAYREGVEITTEEFYERLVKSRQLPTTSAPSVGDFQEVYERLLEEVDSIVSIHIGAKLSATIEAAQTARQSLAKPERIEIVDSQAVSVEIAFVVMEAVEAARAGAKLAEVKAAAESAVPRTQVRFMLDTLEYVRRGGRIGRARAYMGTLLRIKPILSFREGELYPEERVRTRARGLERIIQWAVRQQKVKRAAVGYSTTLDEAESIRERLAMAFPNVKVYLVRFGPVLGTHGGPGNVGVGIMKGE